ncbi:hypothetical protein B484DRAFT_422276 [Ochromonadaceae sp. CCMP2298]|nr:hypothetical protein B484DRAFT_422276 [Ochromonadaceae sp. CCMP2298]
MPAGGAPLPSMWKTVILTTISLHIIIWQVGTNLTPYLLSLHPLLSTLVATFINVMLESYIGLPLMEAQFGEWMRMPRNPPAPHTAPSAATATATAASAATASLLGTAAVPSAPAPTPAPTPASTPASTPTCTPTCTPTPASTSTSSTSTPFACISTTLTTLSLCLNPLWSKSQAWDLSFLDDGLSRGGQLALVAVYYATLLTFSVLNGPPAP